MPEASTLPLARVTNSLFIGVDVELNPSAMATRSPIIVAWLTVFAASELFRLSVIGGRTGSSVFLNITCSDVSCCCRFLLVSPCAKLLELYSYGRSMLDRSSIPEGSGSLGNSQ